MTDNNHESWYEARRPIYEALAKKIKDLIEEVLISKNIPYHNVQYRAKSLESFKEKVEKGISYEYKDMQDLAGIRIIGYVNSEVDKITEAITKSFVIDEKLSTDKTKTLKNDQVGYHSVHLVAKLDKDRDVLPEYSQFKNLCFEIQIRSILQHSWAEIEHDRSYKFSGNIPDETRRRFSLIAGLLEVADNEFDAITKQIDEYGKEIVKKAKSGNLNIPLNATSLEKYLLEKFKEVPGIQKDIDKNRILFNKFINDLLSVEILTLHDLDQKISSIFKKSFMKHYPDATTGGLVVKLMVVIEPNKFLEPFKGRSVNLTKNAIIFYKDNNVDIEEILDKYKIIMSSSALDTAKEK